MKFNLKRITPPIMALACALALFSSCSDGSSGGGQLSVYTITYENVENATNDNPESYTIEDSITLKEASKDDYTFCGWYTNSNFENKVTEITKGSTGEKTLYAKWLVADKFIEVPAVSIDGSKSDEWNPKSDIFVSGRSFNIEAFYMSDHEVTQAEWKDVMETLPENMADTYGTADNNPVNYVSWCDAIVYCNKRSIKEDLTPCYTISDSTDPDDWDNAPRSDNYYTWNDATCDFTANGYRLPTEAEWEWAARGGENYTYAGSNDIDEVAWYTKNTNDTGTREVKTKKPNGYGLYDMSGNVEEWCWDRYGEISSSTPGAGASSGYSRCLRGGVWAHPDHDCGVAKRNCNSSNGPYRYYGFRVVRTAQ